MTQKHLQIRSYSLGQLLVLAFGAQLGPRPERDHLVPPHLINHHVTWPLCRNLDLASASRRKLASIVIFIEFSPRKIGRAAEYSMIRSIVRKLWHRIVFYHCLSVTVDLPSRYHQIKAPAKPQYRRGTPDNTPVSLNRYHLGTADSARYYRYSLARGPDSNWSFEPRRRWMNSGVKRHRRVPSAR